jgi:hypothetical protein
MIDSIGFPHNMIRRSRVHLNFPATRHRMYGHNSTVQYFSYYGVSLGPQLTHVASPWRSECLGAGSLELDGH